MSRIRIAARLLLVAMVLVWPISSHVGLKATASNINQPHGGKPVSSNKFVRNCHSYLTYSDGRRVDEGILKISDVSPASDDYVRIIHPVHGGPLLGHTFSNPDRIEIHILLGDGRVAHYVGTLVADDRIEGRFFITGGQQSSQSVSSAKRPKPLGDEDASWSSGGG